MSARFFILSNHLLCEVDDGVNFSAMQNNERISDCLTTLKHLYNEYPVQRPVGWNPCFFRGL